MEKRGREGPSNPPSPEEEHSERGVLKGRKTLFANGASEDGARAARRKNSAAADRRGRLHYARANDKGKEWRGRWPGKDGGRMDGLSKGAVRNEAQARVEF